MESHFKPWMIERFDLKNKTYPGKEVNPEDKILVCDVGPDIWGGERRMDLLIKCREWARENQTLMGIKEKVGS